MLHHHQPITLITGSTLSTLPHNRLLGRPKIDKSLTVFSSLYRYSPTAIPSIYTQPRHWLATLHPKADATRQRGLGE